MTGWEDETLIVTVTATWPRIIVGNDWPSGMTVGRFEHQTIPASTPIDGQFRVARLLIDKILYEEENASGRAVRWTVNAMVPIQPLSRWLP